MANSLIKNSIGKYRLLEKIGKGANAEVYRARNPDLDRIVAIKILKDSALDETGILSRFRQEARNIAALNHPNIVQVFDFENDKGIYFMVMEHIEGVSLKMYLKNLRQHGLEIHFHKAIRIITEVGSALSYAHNKGIIHRDVKPGNIMIANDGRIVLTDFGLAQVLMGVDSVRVGHVVGTPAYISPEQGQGNVGDARSDIYSLGVVLYEMLTGSYPFRGDTPLDIVQKHIHAPLMPPARLNPDIPPPLEALILRAMEKSPAHRFQNTVDMISALEAIELNQEAPENRPAENPPGDAGSQPVLSLHIVQYGEVISLENKERYLLGRQDEGGAPDVDLSPFEALPNGVSRRHAEILLGEGPQLFLKDLRSTNGTWLNGVRLETDSRVPLNNGDMITLGKLTIQALIQNYRRI